MKKRSIAFMLVFMMLFSITAPDWMVYAQQATPAIEEASAQKDEKEEPATTTEEKEPATTTAEKEPATTTEEKEPATTTEEQTSATTTEEQTSATTTAEQTPAATTEEQTSATTTEEKEPATTTEEQTPVTTKAEGTEFDENKPFTMAMLDQFDDVETYDIDMEKTGIPIANFKIEAETADGEQGTCQLTFPDGLDEIKVGEIQNTAPALLSDTEHGNEHAYAYAHVGKTEVFYIGHLTVHDGEKTDKYTVYTTDKHIDKRTVYVVLKEKEQISLVYRHGQYHAIDYQFQDIKGAIIQEGREDSPWTYDKIFGNDRVRTVANDDHFNGTVTIPRGYRATVLVKGKDGTELHTPIELGKMMKYTYNYPSQPNTIWPDVDWNKDAQRFKASYSIEDVKQDVTVIVRYEKINQFTFNAFYWTQTAYAGGPKNPDARLSIVTDDNRELSPSTTNCKLTFGENQGNDGDKNSVTWKFNGITSKSGSVYYTWEMDQLEINGEPIGVPMVSIADKDATATTKTTLSTGTVITLTVTSLGGNNGSTAKRAYTLKAENCYEDLTVSNGNMVSHVHKEFATRALIGVKDTQYWHGANTDPATGWWPLKKNTLLAKTQPVQWQGFDTFRMKLDDGYKKLNVTFTDKESNVLQTNGDKYVNGTKYIQYLKRKDSNNSSPDSDSLKIYGEYEEVSYDNWGPSDDGYYYCRADNNLKKHMESNPKNGVVLLWFYADASMYGIDYKDGAGGDSAPVAADIANMPLYQNGGEDGYNLIDNTKALVANYVPFDTSGKFVFDHWEILRANPDGPINEIKTDKDNNAYTLEAGDSLPLSKEALEELSDCLYYNKEQKRNTLTLRAVWRNTEGKAPIPYTVNYYITKIQNGNHVGNPILLEGHQHMANEGATLVADLWQDSKKTLSPIITEILQRDNDQKKDYTEGGKVQYVIYEPFTDKKLENISKDNNTVNIYLVQQPNLTINKTVEGKYGDLTKSFKFTIKLTNGATALNGTYSYTGDVVTDISNATAPTDGTLTFADGKAEIELAHGQQITFTNLPFGCNYTVKEDEEEGYETTYNDVSNKGQSDGVLETDQTVRVKNTKTDIAATGIADDSHPFGMMLAIGTAVLLLFAGAGIWRIRRKR